MQDSTHILQAAIDRNTSITVAMPVNGLVHSFRSRLLAQDNDTLWMESIAGQLPALDALIASGESIKIDFRADKLKIEFATVVLERQPAFRVNDSLRVPAVGLRFPTKVDSIQRRSSYRVSVPSRSELHFRFWSITPQADLTVAPENAQELTIDVRDFSAGGIGGTWKRRKTGPANITAGQRLRVELTQHGESLLLDSRLSFVLPVPDPDLRHIGLQFDLEATHLGDRQKMAKLGQIVGNLQREELRRSKIAR